jgi:Fe-S-cluster containining protein
MASDVETPWYEKGLRFKCTGCGGCCTGPDGYVFLGESDLRVLAKHFRLSPEQFSQKYTRFVDGKLALLDKNSIGDCVFLKDKRCSVYEARPVQCKTFPWWTHNLETLEDWENAAKSCEGINHPEAPVISPLEIQKESLKYLDSLLDQNFIP